MTTCTAVSSVANVTEQYDVQKFVDFRGLKEHPNGWFQGHWSNDSPGQSKLSMYREVH